MSGEKPRDLELYYGEEAVMDCDAEGVEKQPITEAVKDGQARGGDFVYWRIDVLNNVRQGVLQASSHGEGVGYYAEGDPRPSSGIRADAPANVGTNEDAATALRLIAEKLKPDTERRIDDALLYAAERACPPGAYQECPNIEECGMDESHEVGLQCWRVFLREYAQAGTDGQEWEKRCSQAECVEDGSCASGGDN